MPHKTAQAGHKRRNGEKQRDLCVEIKPQPESLAHEADLVGFELGGFFGGLDDEGNLVGGEDGAEFVPDTGGEDDVADGEADGAAEGAEGGDGGHVDG